jgi:tRNA nucleotidyltransferase (CCA-adding enzyme)
MHMPAAGANGAIVTAAGALWERLRPETWPVPTNAFPPGTALVGGAVRDACLNRLPAQPDLDLVVSGDAVALCRDLSRRHGGSCVVLDAERSIARLARRGWSIDLARQEGASLEDDLRRRDYRLNALALPLEAGAGLVDPCGGLADLAQRQLVAVSEANLLADPLRLLRGLRLAAQLGFDLEASTRAWIAQHHRAMAPVAGERVLAELEKLAAAPEGQRGLAEAAGSGLLTAWGADSAADGGKLRRLEALSSEAARSRGLSPLETAAALPLARLAACLSPDSLAQLRSSRQLQSRVERLRRWQQRLRQDNGAPLQESERLQLHRQLEQDLPALLLSLPVAEASRWLARWRDPSDALFHPRAAIDGGSLQQALGLKPSPQLGALLEHLMLERAFGRLHSREDTLARAQQWLRSEASRSESEGRRG